MSIHPDLSNFTIDFDRLGPSAPLARTALGQRVIECITNANAVVAVIGAIDAASTRPPLPALDRYLLNDIGVEAARDDVKILTGRIVRQIVEHLGGEHVRTGVEITEASIFTTGSIYRLPTTIRGRMNAADRRAWAERQVARFGGDSHTRV